MYSTVVFCLLTMSGTLAMPVADTMNSTQLATGVVQDATQAVGVTVLPTVVDVNEQPTTTQSTPKVTNNAPATTSAVTEAAVVETTAAQPKFTCDGKTAGLYADPDSCFQYWECAVGFTDAFLRRCAPVGPVFDPAKQRCDWPENVPAPCGTKPDTDENVRVRSSVLSRSSPSFSCAGKQPGLYSDPADCSMYYECVPGHPVYHRPCAPGGLVFDPATQRCMWPHEVAGPCGLHSTRQASADLPAGQVADNVAFCAGKLPGLYSDPADCSMYYECVLGHPVYHRPCAPGGLVFDPATQRCLWPHEVSGTCGVPSGSQEPSGPQGLPGPEVVNVFSTDYYNYYDEVAQSICTAATDTPSFVFAIRRDCRSNGDGLTCNDMCASRKEAMRAIVNGQGSTSDCIDAVHVYKNRPVLAPNPDVQTDAGIVGLGTYRYHQRGCTWRANHCGPNYCCCRLR